MVAKKILSAVDDLEICRFPFCPGQSRNGRNERKGKNNPDF